jgi:hypothetical protein
MTNTPTLQIVKDIVDPMYGVLHVPSQKVYCQGKLKAAQEAMADPRGLDEISAMPMDHSWVLVDSTKLTA